MQVSNNDFFNSVVKELYCPTMKLHEVVTKYEIFKALQSSSTGKYNTVIRLFDVSNNIVCVIFYHNNSNTSEEAIQELRNGYHNNQFNYTAQDGTGKQHSIKSIINWDYEGFTAGVSHKGAIQLTEAYKDLKYNKAIALYTKMKGHNLFHPFYDIASARLTMKYDDQNANDWYLKVKDRKGIERQVEISMSNTGFKNTEFGILEINSIPVSDDEDLEVCAMFDSADGGLGMYKCANIDLSKWRPSPESGIIWAEGDNYPSFDIIAQDASPSLTNKYRTNNCIAYWGALETNEPISIDNTTDTSNVNLSIITSRIQSAILNKSKFILTFMPSTLSPSSTTNSVNVDGQTIYYHFPTWVLEMINQNANNKFSNALYKVSTTNIYNLNTNSDNVLVYVINWQNQAIRNLYMNSCTRIVNAIKNHIVLDPNNPQNNKRLIDYIDVVKVAFWGTWGEGVAYKEITGYNPDDGPKPDEIVNEAPSAVNLIDISEHIISLFNEINTSEGETRIVCLLPLMSYFNSSFPRIYRDYILSGIDPRESANSNSNRVVGYFFDGVGSNIAYWHQESAHDFDYTPEVMNKLFLAHREKPIYLECSTHVSKNEMPTYQNLINFIRYFRCAYFNPLNIFFTDKDCKYNEIAMLKDISRYVGIKLGLLSFDYEYGDSDDSIKIMLRFLNCGTSKIYHENWKLKYHLIGGGDHIIKESNFNLRNIKAAFEEDAPNWHDVADFNTTSQTTYNNNAETVDFGRAIVKGSDKLYISIEDTTGVYDHMYLCNSEDYIQRDNLGRYFLIKF